MKRRGPKQRRRARAETAGSEIMTLYGAAEYLHCNASFVYRLLKNGEMRGFKLRIGGGSDWRIFRRDLEHWIEQYQSGSGGWRFRREDIDRWIAQQQEHAQAGETASTPERRGRRKE